MGVSKEVVESSLTAKLTPSHLVSYLLLFPVYAHVSVLYLPVVIIS